MWVGPARRATSFLPLPLLPLPPLSSRPAAQSTTPPPEDVPVLTAPRPRPAFSSASRPRRAPPLPDPTPAPLSTCCQGGPPASPIRRARRRFSEPATAPPSGPPQVTAARAWRERGSREEAAGSAAAET